MRQRLAILHRTLKRLLAAGELTPIRIGTRVLFERAELQRLIASRREPTTTDAGGAARRRGRYFEMSRQAYPARLTLTAIRREYARRLVTGAELEPRALLRIFGGLPAPPSDIARLVASELADTRWTALSLAEAIERCSVYGEAARGLLQLFGRLRDEEELALLMGDDRALGWGDVGLFAALRLTPAELLRLLVAAEQPRGHAAADERVYRALNTARRRTRRALSR